MKLFRRIAAALAVVAGFAVSAHAEAPTKIVIMHTGVAPYLAAFVAKDQGFFEKRGLDVTIKLGANGSVLMAALIAGSAQIATPTPTIFLQGVEGGLDVVALASTNEFPDNTKSGLVARQGSGIKGPADLVGKKVGVPGIGGLLDVVLRKWLMDNKVDTTKVHFVETPFPPMADMLKADQIDAAVAVDPFLGRIVGSGSGYYVADYTKSIPAGAVGSVWAATREWADKHPAAVKAFQEAIVEAIAFAKSNEKAARDSVLHYTKLPPQAVAHMVLPNLTAKMGPAQLQPWVDIAKAQGTIRKDIDVKKLIAPWRAGS